MKTKQVDEQFTFNRKSLGEGYVYMSSAEVVCYNLEEK